tara:strand:+ start:64 stop:267 length:204 start_codon:yes stop_codon:yes gene_type:complete
MSRGARYDQIVADIESADDFDELELIRASIVSYQAQRGGVSLELVLECGELTKLLSDKQHNINKDNQ